MDCWLVAGTQAGCRHAEGCTKSFVHSFSPLPCRLPCHAIQDGHRQRTVNWVDSTGGTNAAFDFTTKGILQEALARSELWRLVDAQVRQERGESCTCKVA